MAFPSPTFSWQYKDFKDFVGAYVNVLTDADLFITLQGHLLIPSMKSAYVTIFRVLVRHTTVQGTYADSAEIRIEYEKG